MAKTFGPLEAVGAVIESVKAVLDVHQSQQESLAKAGDQASGVGCANPIEVIDSGTEYLTGQEPSHRDAVDHHASLAAAQFHAGSNDLAKSHRDLAIRHAQSAGLDAVKIMETVYGQFEGMEVPLEFIPHGMDTELEKAEARRQPPMGQRQINMDRERADREFELRRKGFLPEQKFTPRETVDSEPDQKPLVTKDEPSFEAFDDASGKGVDKKHVGKTPDDRTPELLNDPQHDEVQKGAVCEELKKKPAKKAEDEDEESSEELDKSDPATWRHPAMEGKSKTLGRKIRDIKNKIVAPIEQALAGADEPTHGFLGSKTPWQEDLADMDAEKKAARKPAKKAEDEDEESGEESVEKAGDFKSRQVRDIKQAKGFTRARLAVKGENPSTEQQLDGKGRPVDGGDPANAVLHKQKKDCK